MTTATTKNPAAVALGSLGGQAKSKRKVAAARANLRKANAARKNGQKGGWPKGKPRKARNTRFAFTMETLPDGSRRVIRREVPKGKRR